MKIMKPVWKKIYDVSIYSQSKEELMGYNVYSLHEELMILESYIGDNNVQVIIG